LKREEKESVTCWRHMHFLNRSKTTRFVPFRRRTENILCLALVGKFFFAGGFMYFYVIFKEWTSLSSVTFVGGILTEKIRRKHFLWSPVL
jgi:hypothetical protein